MAIKEGGAIGFSVSAVNTSVLVVDSERISASFVDPGGTLGHPVM